jgi:hypothetical protein
MQRATALASDDTPLASRRGARAVPRPPPRRGWVFMALQAVLYYLVRRARRRSAPQRPRAGYMC